MSCFARCLREGDATAKKPSTPWGRWIENNVELISMRHRSNTKLREITYVIVSIGIRLTHNLGGLGAGHLDPYRWQPTFKGEALYEDSITKSTGCFTPLSFRTGIVRNPSGRNSNLSGHSPPCEVDPVQSMYRRSLWYFLSCHFPQKMPRIT